MRIPVWDFDGLAIWGVPGQILYGALSRDLTGLASGSERAKYGHAHNAPWLHRQIPQGALVGLSRATTGIHTVWQAVLYYTWSIDLAMGTPPYRIEAGCPCRPHMGLGRGGYLVAELKLKMWKMTGLKICTLISAKRCYFWNVTEIFTSMEHWAKRLFCRILKRLFISSITGQNDQRLQIFASYLSGILKSFWNEIFLIVSSFATNFSLIYYRGWGRVCFHPL